MTVKGEVKMYASIFKNKFKTAVIVAAIFVLLSVVVYYISYALGYGRYAIVIALGFSLVTSIASYWNSDKVVIAINHAHPADDAQYSEVRGALQRVCHAADIPVPKLYVMDDPSPNAFATGRNPKHAAVCVTTGLVSSLDYYQIEGVIAHEAAHIRNYDILLSTVASVMIGAVIMISDIWSRSLFFGGRRSRNDEKDGANGILMIIGLVFVILAPIAGQLLRLALSRSREYLADATAVEFTHNPEGLATALETIGGIAQPVRCANSATANMYISDPILAANGRRGMSLFATHPPIEKRVEAIRNMEY